VSTRANQEAITLAMGRNIVPHRCRHCRAYGQAAAWSGPGHDDGRDRNLVGWQCRHCGGTSWLSRGAIVRKAKAL
jgi:hypothetical protein